MLTYNAIVFGRDGNNSIDAVINSLLSQTELPQRIVLIDDGSTDGMKEKMKECAERYPEFFTFCETDNTTRDYKRLATLWNIGLITGCDLHVICPCDASYPPDYAERIIKEFENDLRLALCSGDWGQSRKVVPHGAGRFVRQSFFFKHYPQGYIPRVGYESEIIIRALTHGWTIKILNDVRFTHHDKLGGSHNFTNWGRSMKALGYHPLFVLARFAINFLFNKDIGRVGAFKIFWSYLTFKPTEDGYYSLWPKEVRQAERQYQKERLKQLILGRSAL